MLNGLHPTSLVDRFLNGLATFVPGSPSPLVARPLAGTGHDDWPRLYSMLWDYYLGVGLYDDLARARYGQERWTQAIKNLRSPVLEVVEFYVAHVWPGDLETALPLERENDAVAEAIRQVWTWSNWAHQKNVWVRRTAIFGDGFLKVAQPEGKKRVYHQIIDPRVVTEFDTDERGFVTYIRLTDQRTRRDNGQAYYRTEVWEKLGTPDAGRVRVWEHTTNDVRVERLSGLVSDDPLEPTYGIDFLPFVWCPFRDIGERRGMNSFLQAKEEIDELNALVTRLHQLLFRFNKPTQALLGEGFDSDGRPNVPASMRNRDGSLAAGTVTIGDDDFLEIPGGTHLEYLVPDIKWDAHLQSIEAHTGHIENKLPELKYGRLSSDRDLSGRALRYLLAPALKRCEEVRANLEDGLVRADCMALTIGAAQKLPGFTDLGTFEAGDFDHRFTPRPILPASPEELAERAKVESETALLRIQAGVSQSTAIKELGFDPVREARLREVTSADLAEQILAAFEKGQ